MNPAVYAILGSIVGGLVAGTFSVMVARQTQKNADKAWMRDNRRELYDRFLTHAQVLLIALVEPRHDPRADEVHDAHVEFMSVYAAIQAVAEREVIEATRTYGYELLKLKRLVAAGSPKANSVASQVRHYRHEAIDTMRAELGLTGTVKPLEPAES
jgi:hypothetical protein